LKGGENLARETFEYSVAHYNEAIMYLEEKWNRKLTDHEKHIAIEMYRFGRLVEMDSYYTGESIEGLVKISDTYSNNK
jgi:hypothetical protein